MAAGSRFTSPPARSRGACLWCAMKARDCTVRASGSRLAMARRWTGSHAGRQTEFALLSLDARREPLYMGATAGPGNQAAGERAGGDSAPLGLLAQFRRTALPL